MGRPLPVAGGAMGDNRGKPPPTGHSSDAKTAHRSTTMLEDCATPTLDINRGWATYT